LAHCRCSTCAHSAGAGTSAITYLSDYDKLPPPQPAIIIMVIISIIIIAIVVSFHIIQVLLESSPNSPLAPEAFHTFSACLFFRAHLLPLISLHLALQTNWALLCSHVIFQFHASAEHWALLLLNDVWTSCLGNCPCSLSPWLGKWL
jgi:hypothetical protein